MWCSFSTPNGSDQYEHFFLIGKQQPLIYLLASIKGHHRVSILFLQLCGCLINPAVDQVIIENRQGLVYVRNSISRHLPTSVRKLEAVGLHDLHFVVFIKTLGAKALQRIGQDWLLSTAGSVFLLVPGIYICLLINLFEIFSSSQKVSSARQGPD